MVAMRYDTSFLVDRSGQVSQRHCGLHHTDTGLGLVGASRLA